MAQSDEHFVEVMRILNGFEKIGEPVSVAEIEERVDFSEDTVRRKLKVMEKYGMVFKKGTLYFPTFKFEESRFYPKSVQGDS